MEPSQRHLLTLGRPQHLFLTTLCRLPLEYPWFTITRSVSCSFISSMSGPLQFLNNSNQGRLAAGQSKGPHKAKPSEVRHLSAHTSQKNSPKACFDPPLEVVPSRNTLAYNRRATDPVRPDLAGLLVKNKNLLAELRNLQNKLFIKETSLQEMKSELESYKENNVQQSFQIMSLKDDIKNLEELIASLTRIKSLKNTNIQSLERGNWDLTERITELENLLREHLVERKKAELKADLLEKKLAGSNRFTPYMSMKGQEDSLDSFMMKDKDEAILAKNFEKDTIFHSEGAKDGQKIWDKCQQDLIHKEKEVPELDGLPYSFSWETKTARSHYQKFLSQLSALTSNSVEPIPAMEEAMAESIQEPGANEPFWMSRTEGLQQEIQMLTKRLEKLYHHCEETAGKLPEADEKYKEHKRPLKRLEGKIAINELFQGRLDLDMNKDKTIEKLRQSLSKLEAMKGKKVMETDLKITLDSAEQEAKRDKERAHQMLETITPELCTAKSTPEEASGQQELVNFRETIMKMLGFNMKTADKKIINHLKLIIQVYEESDKSKIASECETGQDNE
uniref:Coiled-coil domain-containing protein 170-like n=1 Tax=Sus scrofa TaxID=9823 RepID=A0A8D0SJW1_PIG